MTGKRVGVEGMRRTLGWREVWLVAVILGVALPRGYALFTCRSTLLDADEAVLGLMARHILRGHLPIFFYGQNYLGSIEAIWAAVLFAVFGATPLVLKFAALSWFCAFLWVEHFLTKEVAGQFTARISTLLLSASPAFLTVHSLKAFGYMSVLFLGTLALLLTTRALRSGLSWRLAALIGTVIGVGWWTHFLTIAFAAPIALVLAAKFRARLLSRSGAALVGGFIVGSLPFWVFNIFRSLASFRLRAPNHVGFWPGLLGFFKPAIPIFLGMRPEGGASDYFPLGTVFALLIFAAALTLPLLAYLTGPPTRSVLNGRLLLLVMLAFFPFLFAASGFGAAANEPRYLIPLYAGIYALFLLGFSRSIQVVLAAALLVINLNGSFRITADDIATSLNAEPNDALIAFLRQHHVRTAYAPYWIAYRLAFESQEEIICTSPRFGVRYQPYLALVASDQARAYIEFNAAKYEGTWASVPPPASYSMTRVGNFSVFLPGTPSPPAAPAAPK